ncbi:MAG: DUF739 domain-containing protein [Clostridia bacterium]|nr:DUF739 domain-containing protein [Clostridia bacterium]
MIKVNLLKGEMVKAGYTQAKLAKELGISSKTFYLKLKKGVFNSNEIDAMIDLLGISDPVGIFFAK